MGPLVKPDFYSNCNKQENNAINKSKSAANAKIFDELFIIPPVKKLRAISAFYKKNRQSQ